MEAVLTELGEISPQDAIIGWSTADCAARGRKVFGHRGAFGMMELFTPHPRRLRIVPLFDSCSPDGLLIAAARAGEEEAFALLVARYEGPLLRAAISRLGRREVAEEAVQEAFLCAHRWLTTYDSRYSFRTWLWTILLNQCSRQARREAKQCIPPAINRRDAETRPLASPLDQLLARESGERVHELLSRLPEAQADALRLRFFGDLTFPEIAQAMKCSEAGAKNRVKSGLLKLAQWLKRGDRQTAYRSSGDLP